jgi:Gpi18-like mannosyltransferase
MSAAATSAAAEQVRGLVSWEAWQAVIPAYVTTRAVLFFIVFVSTLAIPLVPKFGLYAHASPDNPLLDGLVRWDSWSYIYIATRGYSLGDVGTGEIATVPFFPLYPLVLRTVAVFTGNVFVSGVVVANAALLVALIYLYRLARREFESETATRAVLYLAAAPGAIFFSAVYSESLFVALVAATFYYAGEGRWWRAAVLGALAASARNTGVLLAGVRAVPAKSAATADGGIGLARIL